MAIGACRLAGDPLAGAVVQRGATIERGRDLQAQPGPPALHARQEADVDVTRRGHQLGLAGALGIEHIDDHAGGTHARDALAGDERVRIDQRHHRPRQPGGDECVAARRCVALMRTRLQRDPGGAASKVDAGRARLAQRHRLGVGFARCLRVAAADDRPSAAAITQPTRGFGSLRPMAW